MKSMRMILMSLGLVLINSQLNARSLDLTPMMKDRYENDCSIREGYDLYNSESGLDKKLQPFTGKAKYVEHQVYSSTQFPLKNVTYRGVPIIKIEYSYGNIAKQINQTLYFNVSTAQARKNFSKIKFKIKQDAAMAGLSIDKEGKLMRVQCYWPDPYFKY